MVVVGVEGRDGRDISLRGPDIKPGPLWSVVVVGCCDVDGGGGCVVCGVFCLVGGVLCGSGSSSDDEVVEESEEESDESSGVDLFGGRSPSGSSRTRVLVSGLWALGEVPGCRDVELRQLACVRRSFLRRLLERRLDPRTWIQSSPFD